MAEDPWHCRSLPQALARRAPLHPRLRNTRTVLAEAQQLVEQVLAKGFIDGPCVDLLAVVPSLPLLVQTAVRVHQRREGDAVCVWGIDVVGVLGRMERRAVLVAPTQRAVLIFSPRGVLDAAGTFHRRSGVEWDPHVTEHDWY